MKWIKKGHIFKPNGTFEWSKEYAQIPRPIVLKDRVRIFYATRYYDDNAQPISQTSFIDVDKVDLSKVIYVHETASLELGEESNFSQHGIHPTMVLKEKNETLLFYQGWKRLTEYPYETAISLAKSIDDGLTFTQVNRSPVFQKSESDPYFVNGAFILPRDNDYIMYYSGGIKWLMNEEKKESVYVIKMATSTDLIDWRKCNVEIIQAKAINECQNAPCVIQIGGLYHMWFSYRAAVDFRNSDNGYRIGYARSYDLYNWERCDEVCGISVADSDDWDAEMICYPYVFQIDDRIIMLYCGNYFGKSGFGYAELRIN